MVINRRKSDRFDSESQDRFMLELKGFLVGLLFYVIFRMGKAFLRKRRVAHILRPVPGMKGAPIMGLFWFNLRNLHRIYESRLDMVTEYGPTVKIPTNLFYDGGILITKPEDVRHILADKFHNYIKVPIIHIEVKGITKGFAAVVVVSHVSSINISLGKCII